MPFVKAFFYLKSLPSSTPPLVTLMRTLRNIGLSFVLFTASDKVHATGMTKLMLFFVPSVSPLLWRTPASTQDSFRIQITHLVNSWRLLFSLVFMLMTLSTSWRTLPSRFCFPAFYLSNAKLTSWVSSSGSWEFIFLGISRLLQLPCTLINRVLQQIWLKASSVTRTILPPRLHLIVPEYPSTQSRLHLTMMTPLLKSGVKKPIRV